MKIENEITVLVTSDYNTLHKELLKNGSRQNCLENNLYKKNKKCYNIKSKKVSSNLVF